MIVDRHDPHERQHDQAREDAAQHQVDVDLVQGGVDVAGLVADDLAASRPAGAAPGRAARLALTASITSTVFAPALPADLERDGRARR